MSTMDVKWRIERHNQDALQSVIEADPTDTINKVIIKVFNENQVELSAKLASVLRAKHWESRQDETIHEISDKDLAKVIETERAKNYILVIDDELPSGSFSHSCMHSQRTFLVTFT